MHGTNIEITARILQDHHRALDNMERLIIDMLLPNTTVIDPLKIKSLSIQTIGATHKV